MGVLRLKDETLEELIEKDPYELFTLDAPERRRTRKLMRPEVFGATIIGATLALGIALLTFWNARESDEVEGEQPFAYIEMKAIDPDGRLVAGAIVRDGEEQLGVTDSFGEWRRFMRVRLGSTVTLTLSKRAGGVLLTGAKTLAVPPASPKDGELKLAGSVQLTRSGVVEGGALSGGRKTVRREARDESAETIVAKRAGGRTVPRSAEEREAAADAEISALATAAREAAREARTRLTGVPGEKHTVTAESEATAAAAAQALATAKQARDANDSEASFVTVPAEPDTAASAAAATYDQIWFSTPVTPPPALASVLNATAKRAKELGVRVDQTSPWRLRMSHVEAPGSGIGLILVEGFYAEQPQFSFLRNYHDSEQQTARDVLYGATLHVPFAHTAQLRDGGWGLMPTTPRLFALTAGRQLETSDGRLLRVESSGQNLRLGPGADASCGAQAKVCRLQASGLQRISPTPGWQRLTMTALGPVPSDVRIYVSGYLALAQADGRFSYWGQAGGAANATVIRKGRIVLRARLDQMQRGGPTLSLPQAPLSRR